MVKEDRQSSNAKYDCLLFDMDDTLYPYSCGLAKHITYNIKEFMVQKLGIGEAESMEIGFLLYKYYGTTLAGLKAADYNFDFDDYFSFAHGNLPYELIKPDPDLRSILLSIPIRKVLFTNSDMGHTSRALRQLGVEDCFDQIISFETLNPINKGDSPSIEGVNDLSAEVFEIVRYAAENNTNPTLPKSPLICKPFKEAFERVFKIAEIDPKRTLFFDDSTRNMITGKQMGLNTVVVGKRERVEGADYALESINEIKEAFPELFEAKDVDKEDDTRYSKELAIETHAQA